jgi:hypothetical protein
VARWGVKGGPGQKLTVSGYTEDGRPVVEFFYIVETHGVSTTTVLEFFQREGVVPDWVGFFESSVEKGWNPKSTKLKLETAILDVYGPEYLNEWKLKWRKIFDE